MNILKKFIFQQTCFDLVNDTLTVSRIESGKFELVLEPVDSFDLLEEIIVPIRAAADNKVILETLIQQKLAAVLFSQTN